MRHFGLMICVAFVLVIGPAGSVLGASSIQDFDNPGSGYATYNYYGGFPAQLLSGGPTGNFMRLNYADHGDNLNNLGFDRAQAGAATSVVADFDFRMYGGTRADGFGFVLLSTGVYGTTGANTFQISEEAKAINSLGVGFDIYDNANDDGGENHLSVHFNEALLQNFPIDISSLNLWGDAENQFIHATVVVNLSGGTVSVTLTPSAGSPLQVINNYSVPGLSPYEARVAFGARTGGCTANHDIDNINVAFTGPGAPIPGSAWLFASGFLGLLPFLRREK